MKLKRIIFPICGLIERTRSGAISKIYYYMAKIYFNKIHNLPILNLKGTRLSYIPIPKAACSSIIHSMRSVGQCEYIKYSKEKNIFVFSFVRNPYDRLVSCYLNRVSENPDSKENDFNGLMEKYGGRINSTMTFDEFVEEISEIDDSRADHHFRSQHTFLFDKSGNRLADFIGKVENMKEDVKKISKITGIEIPLSYKNKTIKKIPYSNYYIKEKTRKRIEKRYKEDFKMFDYPQNISKENKDDQ
jgi:hypothetical protein